MHLIIAHGQSYFADMVNGQLLSSVTIHVNGRWHAHLEFNEDEDVPTPLRCHGINVINNF